MAGVTWNRLGRRALLARLGGAAGLTAAGALAACAPGNPSGGSGAAATGRATPSGPQRVDVWWPNADGNPAVPPTWEDFKQRNPGWTGELLQDMNFVKFQTSLAAGILPDAYWTNFETVQVTAYKKMYAPLNAYISRDKVDMNVYVVGSKQGNEFRGQTYAMPRHSNVRSVYVNQRLLREVGLDAEKAPASWDDFTTANARLKRLDSAGLLDRVGFSPAWQIDGATALMYFQANGVPLLTADGNQPGFATPAGVEALKWIADTVTSLGGIAALAEYQKRFPRGTGEALARNGSGLLWGGVWRIGRDAYTAEPAAQIAQWPMPGGPSAKGRTFGYFSATNCAVPTGAARPDAGWAFAKFQASPEGQKYVQETENSWDQAVIPAVANNPAVLAKQPWRKRANELLAQARSTAYFPFPGAADIAAAMNKALEPLLMGTQSPEATMQDMKLQVQTVMDQYR